MSRRTTLRIVALVAVVLTLVLATIGPVFGAGAPTLTISNVSYAERTVTFASSYDTGTANVALIVDSVEVTRTAVPVDSAGTVHLPATLPLTCEVKAAAYSEGGDLLGTSTPIAFNGVEYAPASVKIPLAQYRIVKPSYRFRITTSSRVTKATVYLNGKAAWTGPIDVVNGSATLPAVSVRYGRDTVRIVGGNAWGSKCSATLTVYQLGKTLPPYWRYVLVDKSDYYLYYINGRRVSVRYPVAIGTPWAPTPTGTFRLWYPQPGGGPWGVIRMPLQRRVRGGFVRTSYYIHGTNDPSSIGTAASHGCVRMYNRSVLNLASRLRAYSKRPYTVIRN